MAGSTLSPEAKAILDRKRFMGIRVSGSESLIYDLIGWVREMIEDRWS